jgi:hypothetical protein
MCRSLYVLENGALASKPVAVRWAKETLGEPWVALITAAVSWRPGMEFDKLKETMDFICYTLERCQQLTTDEIQEELK